MNAASSSRRPLLVPHEHGAWAQMGLPQVSAVALTGPSLAGLLLLGATLLGFVAHEPALVLLGVRGARRKDEEGARAKRWLTVLLSGAAVLGGAGLWLAPPTARALLGLAAVLTGVLLGLATRRLERTMLGEFIVIGAFASAGTATALAGGLAWALAVTHLVTWALAFGASVFAVHVVLARAQTKGATDPGVRHALLVTMVCGGGSVLAWQLGLGAVVPLAVAPMALASLVVCLTHISPRALHRLGWTLAAASTATLTLLVLGVHFG